MKRLIALLLISVILLTSCRGTKPEAERPDRDEPLDGIITSPQTTTAPPRTTTPPEPEPSPFFNAEAEELFYLIMTNEHIWNNGTIKGGSLIDLDFDGAPEFLVHHVYINEWGGIDSTNIKIYSFIENKMVEIADLISNYSSGAETPNKLICLYTDENGNKSWVLPYQIVEENRTDYRLSLFDFTTQPVSEFIKFQAVYGNPYIETTNSVFYYNGEELFLTDEEIAVYQEIYARYEAELKWFERDPDDYLENSEKEFFIMDGMFYDADGVYPPVNYFPFAMSEAAFYANVMDKWYILKNNFEISLIPTAYRVDPNVRWENQPMYWKDMNRQELENSLITLVNAYVTEDTEFFIDPGAFSIGAFAKPVIYLYPEETTDISVQVSFPRGGRFTVTYPEYGSGWNVTAHPCGTLINHADNHEYSYLYWDGTGNARWDFSRGFVVKGRDTVKFLQEKLAYLGMIPREYNEFIVYWLPYMQNNAYNLITFQTTAYEESAVLHISPEPDSMLRVFMAFKPLEKPIDIPEQRLESFERTGFSVIEWGGTQVN